MLFLREKQVIYIYIYIYIVLVLNWIPKVLVEFELIKLSFILSN